MPATLQSLGGTLNWGGGYTRYRCRRTNTRRLHYVNDRFSPFPNSDPQQSLVALACLQRTHYVTAAISVASLSSVQISNGTSNKAWTSATKMGCGNPARLQSIF